MKKRLLMCISLPIAALFLSLFLAQCTEEAKKSNTESTPPISTDKNNSVDSVITSEIPKLAGTWELNYITGSRIAFEGLYPQKNPTIMFDVGNNLVSGNTSCNSFSGKLIVNGNKIDFTGPLVMTKMMCQDGKGENIFVETLQKVNTYTVTNDSSLNFMTDEMITMQFAKR